jgi:hypothetical protein
MQCGGAPRSWLISGFPSPAGEVCLTMLQAALIRCGSGPWALFGRLTRARDEVNETFSSSGGASPDVKVECLACSI